MPDLPDAAVTAVCDHEYTLNVQLTHAWCQKCDLVIPVIADGVRDTIRAQGAAAEHARIREGLNAGKDVLMQPGNGYLVDAVAWAHVLGVLGSRAGLLDAAAAPALAKAERARLVALVRTAAAEYRDLAIEYAYETNTLIAQTIDELADLLDGDDDA